jgi:hypothetical protein
VPTQLLAGAGAPPPGLSVGDWTTIQTCLAQAGIPASLTTSQRTKLTANDAAQGDYFGWSVVISGNTVMVGAPYDDDGGGESGSTYVFRRIATEVYLPLILKNSP